MGMTPCIHNGLPVDNYPQSNALIKRVQHVLRNALRTFKLEKHDCILRGHSNRQNRQNGTITT